VQFSLDGQSMLLVNAIDASAFDSTGTRYAVDFDMHTLTATDAAGNQLWVAGSQGSSPQSFNSPRDVEIHPNGQIYVVDSGNARIQIYSRSGQLVSSFGSYGTGAGQFVSPRGLDFDEQGLAYVTDAGCHCVHVLDATGTLVTRIGSFGTSGAYLNGPTGVYVTADKVYVADTANARVQVYSLNGTWLKSIGGPSPELGELFYPGDVAVTESSGLVLVSDPTTWSIKAYRDDGEFLGSHAVTQDNLPISPTALNFDAEQRVLVSFG
jgi:tripartite motif-containing protein 71